MCYIHQYIANVYDNSLIDSVYEITFNKPMKSAIEKHVFSGGGEILPPLEEERVKRVNIQIGVR